MVRKLSALFISAAFALAALTPGALAVTIEQLAATPPEFSIFLYESELSLSGLDVSDVNAYYDGQPMEVTGFVPVAQTGVSVLYIYALDVSASISRRVFDSAKAAVLEAYGRLGSNESLALIAFGDGVETLLEGGETRGEVEAALDSLSPDDMNTDFFGAVDKLIRLAERSGAGRKIGIIISDGVDDFYGGLSRGELEAKLRSGGLSVSAMCVNGTAGDTVEGFGEFARLSGGELFLYDSSDASEKLGELLGRVDSGYMLSLRSETNITDGMAHAINLKLGDAESVTVEVTPTAWIADLSAPRVTGVAFDLDTLSLRVAFSEPVTGAGESGAYTLTGEGGGSVKLAGVTYSEDGAEPCALLTLDSTPYEGEYILSLSGVKDVSMEKNPLENQSVQLMLETGLKEFPVWAYYLIGGGILILAAVIILITVLHGKKKKRESDERLSRLENRAIIGQGTETGNRIFIPKAEGIPVKMSIFDGKGKKYSVTPDIVTSLFIGKHSGNDLVVEDSRVSRQHAVIEKLEAAIAVQDLSSTNGTFVNGARLNPGVSQRLEAGDELTLGDTTIRIISIG